MAWGRGYSYLTCRKAEKGQVHLHLISLCESHIWNIKGSVGYRVVSHQAQRSRLKQPHSHLLVFDTEGIKTRWWEDLGMRLLYSWELSREKTFVDFKVLWLFAKVFSVKFGGVASFSGISEQSAKQKFTNLLNLFPAKVFRYIVCWDTLSSLTYSRANLTCHIYIHIHR